MSPALGRDPVRECLALCYALLGEDGLSSYFGPLVRGLLLAEADDR